MEELDFHRFRDQVNESASYQAMSRGLGVNSNGKSNGIRDKVFRAIEDTFKRQKIDQLVPGGLAALLTANLAHLLPNEKGVQLSMLDLQTHGLRDNDQVRKFLRTHGVDLCAPEDLLYAQKVLDESIGFYDRYLTKSPSGAKIHSQLRQTDNADGICHIFLTASGYGDQKLIPQACGLLRIAYVTDFMEHDERIALMPEVTKKLHGLVEEHVKVKDGKKHYFSNESDPKPIELVEASTRTKDRDRIRAKLLHKPSNHTAEVLDHVGLRYVTKNAADTLRLIYKVFFDPQGALLPYTHIRIGKSKQRLIPTERLVKILEQGGPDAAKVFENLSEFSDGADLDIRTVGGTENPHTSDEYRAIQITVEIPFTILGRRIMFPIEIQFLDESSYLKNHKEASHDDYVASQMGDVSQRVIENNLLTAYKAATSEALSKEI